MASVEKIAITGAAGFIGRALTERFVGEGAEVVGIDVNPNGEQVVTAVGGQWVSGSTVDAQTMLKALEGATAVVHTAAIVSDFGRMEDFIEVNVRGTRNVLDAAEANGIESVVHVSSVASWGYDFSRSPRDESFPRRQGVPYVDTKAASDEMAIRRGAAVVRPGDVYGPRSTPWTIRPVEALKEKSFFLPNGGQGLMTPVFVDDLVDLILLALRNPAASGRAVTGFAGAPVTTSQFFDYYAHLLGMTKTPTLPTPVAAAGVLGMIGLSKLRRREPELSLNALTFINRKETYETDLAHSLLGWQPKVSLDDGMAITAEWLHEVGLLETASAP